MHRKETQSSISLSYGDHLAHIFLWQKAFMLTPIWSIPLIVLIGFVSRGAGHLVMQIGYGLVLFLCVTYFFEDLLKRKIRLDDDNIYFGFKSIAIRNIISIDAVYKARKFLPTSLVLTCSNGQRLKLSLNGLTPESVDCMLKHIQSRNSNVNTAAVLNTLVKCRKIQRKSSNNLQTLDLQYHAAQGLDQSIDVFKLTASKWMRFGPLLAFLLFTTVWISWLGSVFVSLHPQATYQSLSQLGLHKFIEELCGGMLSTLFAPITHSTTAINNFVQNPALTTAACLSIGTFLAYVQSLLCKPNYLLANQSGVTLIKRLGELNLNLASIAWSEITNIKLMRSGNGKDKISIDKNGGKTFDIELSAIAHEDRTSLLKYIEKRVPNGNIDHELSQSMLQKSDRNYTEIWLQSLSQSPERKTLEPLSPGQIIGEDRFEVLNSIGIGGQGTAYLCRPLDGDASQTVVLKETMIPIFANDLVCRKALESFEQEARLLKSLNSDGVVKLLDYFVEDHRAYLVLEHIDGSSLREMIRREGAMSEEHVRDLSLQMCDILKFLHSNGVIHRDFTPDNLILNSKGQLKLIDFNVAQQIKVGATATVVGKHAYLPPEQFRGKATTQSDIYAMGATMFFLLTGKDPEPISQSAPKTLNVETTDALNKIVKRATSLQTKDRYESAGDIENDLLKLDAEAQTVRIL
ncbi:MAG: serine/threonine protein kinase, partial [Candidatus Obscuribacterales bacterium]|nr:serine/threonine protein kinase [Candidatus Obscuribacterales bacterium]